MKYMSSEDLKEKYEHAMESNNVKYEDLPQSSEQAYDMWKNDKGYEDEHDGYWKVGEPPKEFTEDEIRNSYDQLEIEKGNEYGEDDDNDDNDDNYYDDDDE